MPFDGFQGFTTRKPEDEKIDAYPAKYLIMMFNRGGDYIDIYGFPDRGLIVLYHTLHEVLNVYYIDSIQSLLPIVPSLLNTDWTVTEYNSELVNEQVNTQLPDAVTASEK